MSVITARARVRSRIATLDGRRAVALISLAGLGFRLLLLGRQPLWRDEAFTALAAARDPAGMLGIVRNDSAPPLFYLIENAIAHLSGSTFALRLLPAVAGTCAIPLGAALGRRIAGDRAAVGAAVFTAFSPALFLSSLDLRMYALASTLVLATLLAMWRAAEQPDARRLTVLGAFATLALYTHYFTALAIVGQIAALALVMRPPWRTLLRLAVPLGAAAGLLLPWLLAASAQFTHASTPFWVDPLGIRTIFQGLLVQLGSGPPVNPGVRGKAAVQTVQGVGLAVTVFTGVFVLITGRRWGRPVTLMAAAAVIPLAILCAISIKVPLVDARYAVVLCVPLFPLLGAGLAGAARPAWTLAAGAGLLACCFAVALAPTHPETPALVAELQGRIGPHDLIDANPSTYLLLLDQSDPTVVAHLRVVDAQPVPWYYGTAAFPPGAVVPAVPADVVNNRGTITSVFDWGPAGSPPVAGYRLAAHQCWDQLCADTFVPG